MSDDNEVKLRRIHVGGISPEILDSSELESKFRSFGSVKDAIIVKDTLTGLSKGFGFISIECNDKDWQRCTSALNGANGGEANLS
ncbi:heteroproteinous nuclear ribonucleoprotein [Entomophthora muscae]|uniref:Heteroproteinous nuclear ribonucleoprotein n=1 Tax=Entomophthora muscae TaxID=34485 RepID=A0ACC2RJ28_9FUNG|nr:heteroproteinous nuclear ribonucleoprotein [Entomophthora muscae]